MNNPDTALPQRAASSGRFVLAASTNSNLTPTQQQCLEIIDRLNATEFGGWFARSSVLATVQIESAFRPNSFRREPSGVASYGLMQVLGSTAAALVLKGSPDQLYEPETGLRYGVRFMKQGWDLLARRFGRSPSLEEWCAGYNEDYGAAASGHTTRPTSISGWRHETIGSQ
jgi:hypothetical protein